MEELYFLNKWSDFCFLLYFTYTSTYFSWLRVSSTVKLIKILIS